MNNNSTNITKEDKQIQKLISKLKTSINEIDEYDIFSRMLQNLNNINSQVLADFVNILNEPQKYMWNELVHTRRIQVSSSGIKMNVPRRTVKIKRNDVNQNMNQNTTN